MVTEYPTLEALAKWLIWVFLVLSISGCVKANTMYLYSSVPQASNRTVGFLSVRRDSTIGADETASPVFLSRTKDNYVRLTFPSVTYSAGQERGQEETCATYNPSFEGEMKAKECGMPETRNQSQLFTYEDSTGILHPAAFPNSTNATQAVERRTDSTTVTLVFSSSEPVIEEVANSLGSEETLTSIEWTTATSTTTITSTMTSTTPTPTAEALNVAVFAAPSAASTSFDAQAAASSIAAETNWSEASSSSTVAAESEVTARNGVL